jgi:hypothetical protein
LQDSLEVKHIEKKLNLHLANQIRQKIEGKVEETMTEEDAANNVKKYSKNDRNDAITTIGKEKWSQLTWNGRLLLLKKNEKTERYDQLGNVIEFRFFWNKTKHWVSMSPIEKKLIYILFISYDNSNNYSLDANEMLLWMNDLHTWSLQSR